MAVIYIDNDNLLTLDQLRDRRDASGTYIESGSVTAQVEEEDGTDVGAAITLSFVSGSTTGKWQGVIEDATAAALAANAHYVVMIEIAASSDRVGHIEFPATAIVRQE